MQHLGRRRVYSLSDPTAQSAELGFVYDKVRDAELRRNVWRFAIRRAILRPIDTSTIIWSPPAWVAATTYPAGSVISYTPLLLNENEQGANPISYLWYNDVAISGASSNPTPDVATYWHRYFGPVSVEPFVSGPVNAAVPAAPTLGSTSGGGFGQTNYYVVVTYITGAGETLPSGEVEQVVLASNLLTVTSPIAQTGATSYNVYGSTSPGAETLQNSSPIMLGTGWTEPSSGLVAGRGVPLAAIASYWAGELTLLGSTIYSSLISNNTDVPPTNNWLAQGGTYVPLHPLYPLGAGPSSQLTTLNAFRLPYGFLRKAPTDPRGDYSPWLGAPTGPMETDWLFEGDYLVSSSSAPIMLRFVGDIIDVYEFDPMFCEMLSARIGTEIAASLVEPALVQQMISNCRLHYRSEAIEARQANSILIGSEAPPVDLYIAVRL